MKLMLNGKEVSGMGHYVMAGDIKDATAEDSNVLSGKSFYNNNGKREGTMPNRGGMSAELAAGGSVSIPEGYHNGEGVVRAQDLASQTQGTATAGDIASGKTAWVNGSKVTGTGKMGFQYEVTMNLKYNTLVDICEINKSKKYAFEAICVDSPSYFAFGTIVNGGLSKHGENQLTPQVSNGMLQLKNVKSSTFSNYTIRVIGV